MDRGEDFATATAAVRMTHLRCPKGRRQLKLKLHVRYDSNSDAWTPSRNVGQGGSERSASCSPL